MMQLFETTVTVLHAILIALGFTMFLLIVMGISVRKEFKKSVVKHPKFKYLKMECNICGLDVYGSTQASINKTFYWHTQNKHPDAR